MWPFKKKNVKQIYGDGPHRESVLKPPSKEPWTVRHRFLIARLEGFLAGTTLAACIILPVVGVVLLGKSCEDKRQSLEKETNARAAQWATRCVAFCEEQQYLYWDSAPPHPGQHFQQGECVCLRASGGHRAPYWCTENVHGYICRIAE